MSYIETKNFIKESNSKFCRSLPETTTRCAVSETNLFYYYKTFFIVIQVKSLCWEPYLIKKQCFMMEQ